MESLPEKFTGRLVETRVVHRDWDPVGCNKKVAQVGRFYFHAGVRERQIRSLWDKQ